MTDRMLSAEKVDEKLSELYAEFTKPKYDEKAVMCAKVFASEFKEAIDSGELDADRPKCPKCNDTGERPTKTELVFEGERHRMTVPCDCGAKGGT